MNKILTTLTAALLLVSCEQKELLIADKEMPLSLKLSRTEDAKLCYSIYKNNNEIVSQSPLKIEIDGKEVMWQVVSHSNKTSTDNFDMTTGERRNIDLKYQESVIKLSGNIGEQSPIEGSLIVRLYEGGIAYRFTIDHHCDYTIRESSEYRFTDPSGGYHAPNGERIPFGATTIDKIKKAVYMTPVIYQTDEVSFGLHEADLHNYPQLRIKGTENQTGVAIATAAAKFNSPHALPWRVILVGENIADLHNSKSIYLSLSQPAKGDFSWVKSGLSTWDWRVKGMEFGGEVYEMTTNSLKRYVDFCARHGIRYFLLDAEWYDDAAPIVPIEGLDIEELIRYSNSKEVGVILYYDTKYLRKGVKILDFEDVAKQFSDWGAKGVKYGFLGKRESIDSPQEKSQRTEDLIKTAAKNRLIIDFHDGPIPFSGLEREYPNYITREYCHAQMDGRRAFTPGTFTKIACVNLLAGAIDQTNGTYALNTIKERAKGPRNEYLSTVASETARVFITHTGNLSIILDAPESYEAKSDLFAFITSMPEQWDEVRYLEMLWDDRIAVARRSGDDWFFGCVFGDKSGEHTLSLDLLEEGKTYTATIYRDAPDTDYRTNKEAYEIKQLKDVKRGDTIITKVAMGGGYSILFKAN